MKHLKVRIFAMILIVVCAGLVYYSWQQLLQEGRYSFKLAAFGPVGVVGGFFLLLFPGRGGKPTSTKDKVLVLLVFVIGLVAGLVNWYLMDPGFFGK
jgi:NhaP-type Na+/H+ or K+/H+ antiporter